VVPRTSPDGCVRLCQSLHCSTANDTKTLVTYGIPSVGYRCNVRPATRFLGYCRLERSGALRISSMIDLQPRGAIVTSPRWRRSITSSSVGSGTFLDRPDLPAESLDRAAHLVLVVALGHVIEHHQHAARAAVELREPKASVLIRVRINAPARQTPDKRRINRRALWPWTLERLLRAVRRTVTR
jgi:hypothetical protein